VRLAASLRTRIYQGEWSIGARLPTFQELAECYGVALNTVRKSVEVLSAQSLVTSARDCGTTVTAHSAPLAVRDVRSAISDPLILAPSHHIHILSSERVKSLSEELRGQYKLAPSYQRVYKTQSVGDQPYALLEIFVASDVFARFPRRAEQKQKLSKLLREEGHIKVARLRQELTVTHADQQTAILLRYPIAAPIVRVRRWRQSTEEVVIYACTVFYRSDLFVWDITQTEPDADYYDVQVIPEVRPTE